MPNHTWIEITHGAIAGGEESVGSWMYHATGSGVWFDTGHTKAYSDHQEGYEDLCGGSCGDAAAFTAAKARGYDSVQYYAHGDQACGRNSGGGREWAIEVVHTGGVGQYACGALKTVWRAGWEATQDCSCDNNWNDPGGSSLQFNCNGFAMRHQQRAAPRP